jgi:hypothetical protein
VIGPLLLALSMQSSGDLGAAKARDSASTRGLPLAQAVAADAELVKAVQAKNQSKESDEDVLKKDKEWQANQRYPLRQELTTNACALRLKKLLSAEPMVVEAFLMDHKGALVCATRETSDYWQGDEAKWQNTYADGKPAFVDLPALDVSSNAFGVQLSVLVKDGAAKIGALTMTLKVPR